MAFLPSDIPNVTGWFDATDSSTMTIDSATKKISEWRDKIGSVRKYQTDANLQPLLENNVFNGNQAIFFPERQYFKADKPINKGGIFLVHYFPAAPDDGGTGNGDAIHYSTSQDQYTVVISKQYIGPFLTPYSGTSGVFIDGVEKNWSSRNEAYQNLKNKLFIIGMTKADLSTCPNEIYFMTYREFSAFSSKNDYICEIIYTNDSLTIEERQKLEGYLAWKWGIQNQLDPSHPFYSYPPGAYYIRGVTKDKNNNPVSRKIIEIISGAPGYTKEHLSNNDGSFELLLSDDRERILVFTGEPDRHPISIKVKPKEL